MRVKAEQFEVENPKEAMGKFESLLGKLLRVPKSEVQKKRNRMRAGRKKKPKR